MQVGRAQTRAAYIDVVIPLVTVVLAAVVLDEKIGGELIAGGSLILAGVYVGAVAFWAHCRCGRWAG